MKDDEKLKFSGSRQLIIIMVLFWVIAVVLWQTTGKIFYLFNFLYIGTAIGAGIGLYSALPKKKEHWGRKLSQLLMGVYMLDSHGPGFLALSAEQKWQAPWQMGTLALCALWT